MPPTTSHNRPARAREYRAAPNALNAPYPIYPYRIVSLTLPRDYIGVGATGLDGGEGGISAGFIYRPGNNARGRGASSLVYGAAQGRFFGTFSPLTPCIYDEKGRGTDSKTFSLGRKLLILLGAAWPRYKNRVSRPLGPSNFQGLPGAKP
jgi:hypothetical protein